ncbi:MAG: TIGR03067 domain-containing protein, partial [Planctomycetales bacterium]|nr:TIGR03067 domain-containing protein [Planctomycetales bacterium]
TPDDAIQKDRQQIAGLWRVVSVTINENVLAKQFSDKLTVENGRDGAWIIWNQEPQGRKEIGRGTSMFDPAQQPKTIDFIPSTGDQKGQVFLGIYELGENTRRLCFAPVGKPRPQAFASPANSGQILVEFERVEKPE